MVNASFLPKEVLPEVDLSLVDEVSDNKSLLFEALISETLFIPSVCGILVYFLIKLSMLSSLLKDEIDLCNFVKLEALLSRDGSSPSL